ncbi:MAG: 39S ribosomal protein L44, mitochondrial [Peltula sp. TS41687]|nr:MAG: 39S ribosomal protein L44, mitochondrial [Peltula sp. TS41687]
MITRFLTEVSTTFNPFRTTSTTARLFLAFLPPNARHSGMKINTTVLPRESQLPSGLFLKFKDGKEMKLETEKMGVNDVIEVVDRHSRLLRRQEELSGN